LIYLIKCGIIDYAVKVPYTRVADFLTYKELSMTDKDLITFTNKDVGELRGFIKDGEPWFLAGNVCRALGIKDTSRAVQQTKERLKIAGVKGTISSSTLLETNGGKQTVLIINEQCLYELIFQSRKQKAIKFRAWVTGEVLPSIRKTGQYRMEGKLIRRSLTDNIKKSVEDKSDNTKKFAYSNYSRLVNKSLGLENKVNRDLLDADVLEKIAHRENLVSALLAEGKEYIEIKNIIDDLKGE